MTGRRGSRRSGVRGDSAERLCIRSEERLGAVERGAKSAVHSKVSSGRGVESSGVRRRATLRVQSGCGRLCASCPLWLMTIESPLVSVV
eukprot:3073492-Pleurochrysis_carterae.AAC.2